MSSLRQMSRLGALLLGAIAAAALLSPAAVLAAEPTFGQPSVVAELGQPVTISSTISGEDIASVEAVVRLTGHDTEIILPATQVPPDGTWQAQNELDISTSAICACLAPGSSSPNTKFDFHFRVTLTDGTTYDGPIGESVVQDARYTWQEYDQDLVRVHWYAGDQDFARNAAQTANDAINKASQLLGVTLPAPVDLFVYDSEEAMRSAVSPNRENVAGEAHPDIDTMFVWIPPDQAADSFAGVLIAHELTHLVFHEAVDNDYHGVPRWLDEGTAVYLSEGYTDYWKSFISSAVSDSSLIPLDGLRGLFPSTTDGFYLAYAESVASVDYFVRTYGEPTFWQLVKSYAQGVSDDAAFSQATGGDVEAFNRAWFESLDLEPPEPVGPQPGPAGPVPSAWGSGQPPASAPSAGPVGSGEPTAQPGASPAASAQPARSPGTGDEPAAPAQTPTDLTSPLLLVGLIVLVLIIVVVGAIAFQRRQPRGPSGPGWY